MSGPLEELRAAHERVNAASAAYDRLADAPRAVTDEEAEWKTAIGIYRVRVAALLAASSTGERPADERVDDNDAARWADSDEWMAEAIEAGRLVKADCHHGANTYCNHRVRELLTILLDRGLIRPTPPDAGTGTPSGDGRRAPTPFECFQAGMFDGVVAGGKGRLAIDYDPGAVRAAFRSWLDEFVAERPTPAAPSGTTGATTGGRVGGCICVHDADAHVDGLGCVALDVDGEGCRCDADRPPSTGAESRDDQ